MKSLIIILFFVSFCSLMTVYGQEITTDSMCKDNEISNISLYASIQDIEKPKYKSEKGAQVTINLSLKYKNTGNQPFFIYKNWSQISYFWISENLNDLNNNKFILDTHIPYFVPKNNESEFVTLNNFVKLEKGNVFETKVPIILYVKKDANTDFPTDLYQGDGMMN